MKHQIFTLVVMGIISLGARANENRFYRIKVPVHQISCEQEATKLGDRYRELSKTSALTVRCGGTTKIVNQQKEFLFYILDLQYSVPEDIVLPMIQSTYYGRPILGSGASNQYGLYSELSECLKDLSKRTKEFFEVTNHPVLASTCERAVSEYKTTFVVRIDTLGSPKIHLDVVDGFTSEFKTAPLNKAVEKIILANAGVIVAREDNFIYFYSKTTISPYRHSFGDMRKNECQRQLPELNRILKILPAKEVTTGCLSYELSEKTLERIEAVWNQFRILTSYREQEFYYGFDECLSDRERAISQWRSRGYPVNAALCVLADYLNTEEQDRYVMDIY